jgi:hypothetical protein
MWTLFLRGFLLWGNSLLQFVKFRHTLYTNRTALFEITFLWTPKKSKWMVLALIREVLASSPVPIIILRFVAQACTNPGQLNFVQWRLIFWIQLLQVFIFAHKNVYQLTYTKQKTPDNSEARRSLQNFGSSVWKLLYVTPVEPRIWRWRVDRWKICGSLLWPISSLWERHHMKLCLDRGMILKSILSK